jgi:prophage regulatory protein
MRKIKFMRQPAVMERTGLKESTFYKEIQEGSFPRPVPISERCVAWREDQIDEWCKAKAEGRARKVWPEEIKSPDGRLRYVRYPLHQPSPELLHALDKYGGIVSRVDIAFDLWPRKMSTEQMAAFVKSNALLRWRRSGKMFDYETTAYWIEQHRDTETPDRNLLMYPDLPSKLSNRTDPIVHLELRLQTAEAVKKENIRSPSDLIALNSRQLFDKHIRIVDFQRHIQRDIMDAEQKNRVRGFYSRYYQNRVQPFKDRQPDFVARMKSINSAFVIGDQLTWGAKSGSKDQLTWKPAEPIIDPIMEIASEATVFGFIS